MWSSRHILFSHVALIVLMIASVVVCFLPTSALAAAVCSGTAVVGGQCPNDSAPEAWGQCPSEWYISGAGFGVDKQAQDDVSRSYIECFNPSTRAISRTIGTCKYFSTSTGGKVTAACQDWSYNGGPDASITCPFGYIFTAAAFSRDNQSKIVRGGALCWDPATGLTVDSVGNISGYEVGIQCNGFAEALQKLGFSSNSTGNSSGRLVRGLASCVGPVTAPASCVNPVFNSGTSGVYNTSGTKIGSICNNTSFNIRCDYGVSSDNIFNTGGCSFSGFIGTAAQFSCSGAVPGTWSANCTIGAGGTGNICSAMNNPLSLTVNNCTTPPPPGNLTPQGDHWGASGSQSAGGCYVDGWAGDPDFANGDIQVRVKKDGSVITSAFANQFVSGYAASAEAWWAGHGCSGGSCYFGPINISSWMSDGISHSISVEAQDVNSSGGSLGTWVPLQVDGVSKTPKSLTCPATVSPINGQCGSSNGGSFSSAPSSGLCNAGAASSVTLSGSTWQWSCAGSNGGSNSPLCTATKSVTSTATLIIERVDQNYVDTGGTSTTQARYASDSSGSSAWTTSNPVTFSSLPADTYYAYATPLSGMTVTVGTCNNSSCSPSGLTYSLPSLSCSGTQCVQDLSIAAGATKKVVFKYTPTSTAVNGACGTANGVTSPTPPPPSGYTLCSTPYGGTSPSQSGGNWTWQCNGSNGGSPASCTAPVAKQTISGLRLNTANGQAFVPPTYPGAAVSITPSAISCDCAANNHADGSYFADLYIGQTYTISVPSVPGYNVGYQEYNFIGGAWQAGPVTSGNSLTKTIPSNGYALWWVFTPSPGAILGLVFIDDGGGLGATYAGNGFWDWDWSTNTGESLVEDPSMSCAGALGAPYTKLGGMTISGSGPTPFTVGAPQRCQDPSIDNYPYWISSGSAILATLNPGTYNVTLTPPSGWVCTHCSDSVNVPAGNFGNIAPVFGIRPANTAPVVANPNHGITAGSAYTHIGATATDVDNNITGYSWAWAPSNPCLDSNGIGISCPALSGSISGSVSGGASAVSVPGPTFTPAVPGTYKLRLTVTDAGGLIGFNNGIDTATAAPPGGVVGIVFNDNGGTTGIAGNGQWEGDEAFVEDVGVNCAGSYMAPANTVVGGINISGSGPTPFIGVKPDLCQPPAWGSYPYYGSAHDASNPPGPGLTLAPGTYTVTLAPPAGWLCTNCTASNLTVPSDGFGNAWFGIRQNNVDLVVDVLCVELGSGIPCAASDTVQAGQVINFRGRVRNAGTMNIGSPFPNHFDIDSNAVSLSPDPTIPSLAAGVSTKINSGTWTATLGTHTVRLCADQPGSGVAETNESNNCATRTVNVVPPSVCGNSIVESGEACDGGASGNGSCPLTCNATCTAVNSCITGNFTLVDSGGNFVMTIIEPFPAQGVAYSGTRTFTVVPAGGFNQNVILTISSITSNAPIVDIKCSLGGSAYDVCTNSSVVTATIAPGQYATGAPLRIQISNSTNAEMYTLVVHGQDPSGAKVFDKTVRLEVINPVPGR